MELQTSERAAGLFGLLKQWCGALLQTQINAPMDRTRHGALLCPACGRIHGRCHEAAFPLMYVAGKTGDMRYLSAAKALFKWGENLS